MNNPTNPYDDPNLIKRILKRIIGRKREVIAIVAALAAGKNILLEGPPGTTKSTILRIIAEESNIPFYMIEGSADLTPQKLIGVFNPAKVISEGFKPEYFEPGPLTKAMSEGGLLYIEEFNRMPEEAANVLIRAAEEREIVIPRYGIVRAKPSFRIICAMNPYDDVGTNRLSRALLDRFCRLKLTYQSRGEEIEIVKLRTGCNCKWLVELAVDLARETRHHPALKMGSSIRGAIDMVLIAMKLAQFNNNQISYSDLLYAAILGMSSKIWVSDPDTEPEYVIKEILDKLLRRYFNIAEQQDLEKLFFDLRPNFDSFKHDVDNAHYKKQLNHASSPFSRSSSENVAQGNEHNKRMVFLKVEDNTDREESYLERLIRLAKIAPKRVSIEISNNTALMVDLLKSLDTLDKRKRIRDLDILELLALCLPYLKDDFKYLARKYATNIILKIVSKSQWGLKRGNIAGNQPYSWNSDDIDLDNTIEAIIDQCAISSEVIRVFERERTMKAYALIIDRSASMSGLKIALAALLSAMLVYSSANSSLVITAFNTKVDFIKHFNEILPPNIVVDKILNLKAYGYTDIALALRTTYKELMKSGLSEYIGILITDGEWTAGENPLKYASLFDRLHVVCVPSKWAGFARAIARKGHGEFFFIRNLSDIFRHNLIVT